MATESLETTKNKILQHALAGGFYLVSYSGLTVEGRSFLTEYNRENSPSITDKKLITDVLKDFGLIEWNSEVKGWRVPKNVGEILIELREKNHE